MTWNLGAVGAYLRRPRSGSSSSVFTRALKLFQPMSQLRLPRLRRSRVPRRRRHRPSPPENVEGPAVGSAVANGPEVALGLQDRTRATGRHRPVLLCEQQHVYTHTHVVFRAKKKQQREMRSFIASPAIVCAAAPAEAAPATAASPLAGPLDRASPQSGAESETACRQVA